MFLLGFPYDASSGNIEAALTCLAVELTCCLIFSTAFRYTPEYERLKQFSVERHVLAKK